MKQWLCFGILLGWAAVALANMGSTNPPTGTCLRITASRLNIRSGAGTSYRIIKTVSYGTSFRYAGGRLYSSGYYWYKLDLGRGQYGWAAGKYLQKCSSGGSSGNTYGGCTGRGTVNYNGKTVSDSRVRAKLQQIANFFCRGIIVFSGNRNNGGRSLHDAHRAADFWVNGFNARTDGGKIWNAFRASTLFTDEAWEVIWHGRYTVTGGIHFHIGRYGYSRSTCYKMEGTTTSNRGDYRCH